MSDDEDEGNGYGKPPRHSRFKKGKSGCPDGGWPKRKANQAAKLAENKQKQDEISQTVIEWFAGTRPVKINGRVEMLTRLQLAFVQLEEDALVKRDAAARKLLFDVAGKNGWLKAPPPKQPGGGVLVVYPIMQQQEWIDATEGDHHLTKDPLEGLLTDDENKKRLAAFDARGRRKLNEDDD
ncbi:MAG: DUF5681 domain-containing protein [Terricaulis sp.]